MRIFGAAIDITFARPDRDGGNRHAFDEHERIAFHHHAIGKRAAIAFVGIADDVFEIARRIGDRLPFDAGREAGAAAAAQPRLRDFGHDGRRADLKARVSARASRRVRHNPRAKADR